MATRSPRRARVRSVILKFAAFCLLAFAMGVTAYASDDEPDRDEPSPPTDTPPPDEVGPRRTGEGALQQAEPSRPEGTDAPRRGWVRGPPAERIEVLPGFYPETVGRFKGKGFWFGSPDRHWVMRMSGFIHVDSRFTRDFEGGSRADDITLRRARIAFDGRFLGDFEYRLMWDNMINPLEPYDFHIDWRPRHEFNLRIGGFKDPFSLERRMRSFALLFIERSYTNALSPNRALGLFAYGQTVDGFFSYETAITSGAGHMETRYTINGPPHFTGRFYFLPFRRLGDAPALHHLGFGASWTIGTDNGEPGRTGLAVVRPMSRGTAYAGRLLFGYLGGDSPVVAAGITDRQAIQLHWQYKQFQAMSEVTRAGHRVGLASPTGGDTTNATYLAHVAWHLMLSYTHIPDDENRFYGVSPTRPFNPAKGHWGGFTSSLRFTEIYMDPNTFPTFADPDTAVRAARGASYSFQWHINSALEVQADVDLNFARGGRPQGQNLPPEVSAGTRLEFRY